MNWKEIKNAAWTVLAWVVSITLIENDGTSFLIEFSGDLAGGAVLLVLGASVVLREIEE